MGVRQAAATVHAAIRSALDFGQHRCRAPPCTCCPTPARRSRPWLLKGWRLGDSGHSNNHQSEGIENQRTCTVEAQLVRIVRLGPYPHLGLTRHPRTHWASPPSPRPICVSSRVWPCTTETWSRIWTPVAPVAGASRQLFRGQARPLLPQPTRLAIGGRRGGWRSVAHAARRQQWGWAGRRRRR